MNETKSTLDWARTYHTAGFSPVQVPYGAKKPNYNGWQEKIFTRDELAERFSCRTNIGLLLGAASRGLVDADFDVPEAVAAGRVLMPHTGMKSGRSHNPLSHYFYLASPVPKHTKFNDVDVDKTTIAELRSSDHQTVVPPSVYIPGIADLKDEDPNVPQPITWENGIEPAKIHGDELERVIAKVAACALVARHWPAAGNEDRHQTDLALAGAFARAGWDPEAARLFIETAARIAGDEKAWKRASDVKSTFERYQAGEKTTGLPTLEKLLTRPVVERLVEWLCLGPERREESSEGTASKARGPSQATRLINLTNDVQLFSTPERKGYAELKTNAHREVWPIRSKAFKIWLAERFYNSEATAANAQALQDALAVIEARALFGSNETHEVFVRLAGDGATVYLDLVDDAWRAVKVDATGWEVIEDCPIKFTRKRGMLPLPVPVTSRSLSDLKKVVNIGSDEQWILFVAWLVAALRPNGPYPILTVHGEQGSAKTFLGKAARFLVDPSKASMRAVPRDERDLMIAATNAHIITIDNLSRIPNWLADSLCRLSTGAGFSTRELFANDDETILEACRPMILNGIAEFTGQGDLLQRMVTLELPVIDEKDRKEERVLWPELERSRPRILGALLDSLSAAIRNHPMVKLGSKPRMADFAVWATAAEEQLGFRSGSFMKAYSANIKNTNTTALESSLVAPVLLRFMQANNEWTGTSSELLYHLKVEALKTENSVGKSRPITERDEWPKSARALSGELARLAPNLRVADVGVQRLPRKGNQRPWRLTLCGEQCKRPSQPSRPSQTPPADTQHPDFQDVANSDTNDGRHDGPGTNDGDRHCGTDGKEPSCDGRGQVVTVDDGGTASQPGSNGCAQHTDFRDDVSSTSESHDACDGHDGKTPTPHSGHRIVNDHLEDF